MKKVHFSSLHDHNVDNVVNFAITVDEIKVALHAKLEHHTMEVDCHTTSVSMIGSETPPFRTGDPKATVFCSSSPQNFFSTLSKLELASRHSHKKAHLPRIIKQTTVTTSPPISGSTEKDRVHFVVNVEDYPLGVSNGRFVE